MIESPETPATDSLKAKKVPDPQSSAEETPHTTAEYRKANFAPERVMTYRNVCDIVDDSNHHILQDALAPILHELGEVLTAKFQKVNDRVDLVDGKRLDGIEEKLELLVKDHKNDEIVSMRISKMNRTLEEQARQIEGLKKQLADLRA